MKKPIQEDFAKKCRIIGRHLFNASVDDNIDKRDLYNLTINALHLLENPYDPIFAGNSKVTTYEAAIAKELQEFDQK